MKANRGIGFLGVLLACWVSAQLGLALESVEADEKALQQAKLETTGSALLQFLQKQCLTEAQTTQIEKCIQDLTDEEYKVRQQASEKLVEIGRLAVPYLKRTQAKGEPESKLRAEECLKRIQQEAQTRGYSVGLIASTVRLVGVKKPAGSAEVLLQYLPWAEDESLHHEIRLSLQKLALRDDKPEPALLQALQAKSPLVRGLAGSVLATLPDQQKKVQALLADPDFSVRQEVGLALAQARDKTALPVLIDLLDKVSQAQSYPVEDLLYRLAADTSPTFPTPKEDVDRRVQIKQVWQQWWKEHSDKVDLARADAVRTLGYTMMILLDKGELFEVEGQANKVRWKIENLSFPLDAEYLQGDRVLVAEQGASRITERNLKGEILWKKDIVEPLVAQRLPNGNTFIVTRYALLEIDRDGKEVLNLSRGEGEMFMRGQKLRNGEIVCITSGNDGSQLLRMNAKGEVLRSFAVNVSTFGGRVQLLPNGNAIVPEMYENRVVEYDADGKEKWSVRIDQPIVASRLSNGNTLITSMTRMSAIEVNAKGETVWEHKAETRLTRAWRR